MRGWIPARDAIRAAMSEHYRPIMLVAMLVEIAAFVYLCVVETMQWIDERSLLHLLEGLPLLLR